MRRGRLIVELFGRELLCLDVDIDDAPEAPVSRETAAPLPPEAVAVPGPGHAMADTALADHSDPDTRGFGFGYPQHPDPGKPLPTRTEAH